MGKMSQLVIACFVSNWHQEFFKETLSHLSCQKKSLLINVLTAVKSSKAKIF